MKTIVTLIVVGVFAFGVGCTDKNAEAEKARQEAEAKARAEAAKKEMEALPKTFETPSYFEKNESAKPTEAKESETHKTKSP